MPPKDEVGDRNRIHIDDLVRICLTASEHGSGDLFNVADGCPMRTNEYYSLVAVVWDYLQLQYLLSFPIQNI